MPSSTRPAHLVFEDHLKLRLAGDTERDVQRNFSPDVVVLSTYGVFRGHDGVRRSAELLSAQLGQSKYQYKIKLTVDDIAFLEWSAQGDRATVKDGVDSFVIRNGLIVAQTIYYRLLPPGSSS